MPYVRPDWVRRVNAMAGGVGGAAAVVPLDADELLALASRSTGLDDFGEPTWEEPFRRLVVALDSEADLHVVGRLLSRHDVLRHLCTRLRIVNAHRRDPSIAQEEIVAPIVVTGPARSGTSILHELLAEDPALRAPRAFEMAHPIVDGGDRDERAGWAESEFDLWSDVQPEFRAVHELAAALPEECLWLLAPAFDLGFWSTCVEIPSFSAWRAQADPVALYRWHRSFLQLLQHGQPPRTWALKSPLHLSRLAALFAVYPDVRVILTHRDPVRTVPSTVSAVAAGRWLRSDGVDPRHVATSVGFGLRMILNGVAAACEALPSGQVTNLHYLDLLHDPVAAIARAYDELGLPFGADQAARITDYVAARPQTKYGVHRYGPDDFGLDADGLRRDFSPYVEAFGVEPESGS